MTSPRPGRRVRGSSTGRPIMALLDLLGRRMALRVLWELRDGALTFRSLQQAAATNPNVLNARLKELRSAGLVMLDSDGYVLSPIGRELLRVFLPLHVWAEDWAKRLRASTELAVNACAHCGRVERRLASARGLRRRSRGG